VKKREKCQKKLPREIRSVWNTKPSIHLFKTGNYVVYSEPKEAGTTELGKICHNHLANFIIHQGCISLLGEIKNKTESPPNLKITRGIEKELKL